MVSEKIWDVLEERGIRIVTNDEKESGSFTELEFVSGLGENFVFDLWHDGTDDGFVKAFCRHAEEFDPDEHVVMWLPLRGTEGVTSSIMALCKDAEEIKHFLENVSNELLGKEKG